MVETSKPYSRSAQGGDMSRIAIALAFVASFSGAGVSAASPNVPPPAPVATPTNVLFILDSSGSMWERVDGQPKVTTAKKVLNDLLAHLPPQTRVGLMTYGHRRKGDCQDIELLSAIGRETAGQIAKRVDALQPKGETPIAAALVKAADALKGVAGPKMVVLVTDGAEECHGDPCAAAKALAAVGADVHVNVVGFHLKPKEREAVECIASGDVRGPGGRRAGGRASDRDAPGAEPALAVVGRSAHRGAERDVVESDHR
jgi:Ca-activated chloride channel family protein